MTMENKPDIRCVEKHGNVVMRRGSYVTEDEHWIVNGVRFDHEPSVSEIDTAYGRNYSRQRVSDD